MSPYIGNIWPMPAGGATGVRFGPLTQIGMDDITGRPVESIMPPAGIRSHACAINAEAEGFDCKYVPDGAFRVDRGQLGRLRGLTRGSGRQSDRDRRE
ncbi:hypothetical protein [Pseudonocardia acidicola]|uniref:Uncharacterized protein n=1 Tax=Pseudonocardia acidicola TaxID=2724939 RepID=A0ABX1SJ00_9PSEU|nr:hypothetical protein [Pseudonocardia acidicola]NMI01561.1 hypothetical protein [Pseudonocardia acidicola]